MARLLAGALFHARVYCTGIAKIMDYPHRHQSMWLMVSIRIIMRTDVCEITLIFISSTTSL